jgi:hypothetical protein
MQFAVGFFQCPKSRDLLSLIWERSYPHQLVSGQTATNGFRVKPMALDIDSNGLIRKRHDDEFSRMRYAEIQIQIGIPQFDTPEAICDKPP